MATDIKLIGLDLDGTLLRKDHSVSERNKQAIRDCLNKGIQVYLVTGRPYCFSKMIAQSMDERIKLIAANGGIYEIGNRCIETPIDECVLNKIIDVLSTFEMKAFFKGKRIFYTHEAYDERFLYDHMNEQLSYKVYSHTQMVWKDLKDHVHDISKILVYHEDETKLHQARQQIGCIGNLEVTDYQKISFDITAKNINKGIIIKKVLQELGYGKDNFMAIGDSNNDIPMFQEAGLSIAMGNANDAIKNICDDVTTPYMDDGVYEAIMKYIIKEGV